MNVVSRANKLLVVVPLLVLSAFVFWWLDTNLSVSAEMKELRSIESELDLPAHQGRSENDSGLSTDWKGAQHNDRFIVLYFGSRGSVDDIVSIFEGNDWVLERRTEGERLTGEDGEPVAGDVRWRFVSDTDPACASIWRSGEFTGDIADSGVFLYHANSDACR